MIFKRIHMAEQAHSPLALALTYIRTASGWTKTRLALALGFADESLISAYERGAKPLTREKLDSLVEPLGHSPEAVDVLLFAHGLIFPEPHAGPTSTIRISLEEGHRIDRVAMAAGRIAAEEIRRELRRRQNLERREAERQEAQKLWARFKTAVLKDQRDLVLAFPEFWNWALAERVSHESERSAAHKVEEALELANLALSIAERVPGEPSWRHRVEGYCWAYIANARRVANDLSGADKAFARAWDLWRAGSESDPELLAEWRLFDLEASLRRAEGRFPEALGLLDCARSACGGDPHANGRILLKREHIFERMGDIQNALAALADAAPFVEATGDPRQLFALRFNMLDDLCHLERYEEAAKLLPQVRELAVEQGNELDLVRLVWLESKMAAGLGREEVAIAGLEQVGRDFMDRELPYDAALSSLDLSVLLLKAGRTAEVQELVVALGWIFRAKGIGREALVALKLFCDAAAQEAATVELARQVIAEIEQARRSSPSLRE